MKPTKIQHGGQFGSSITQATSISYGTVFLLQSETGHLLEAPGTPLLSSLVKLLNQRYENVPLFGTHHVPLSLDDPEKQLIEECVSRYPKQLYYQSYEYLPALSLIDEDDKTTYRVHSALESTESNFTQRSGYGANTEITLPFTHSGSVNYLIELGAGIGLTCFPEIETSRHLNQLKDKAYPPQLFLGCGKAISKYFARKGFYKNGIFSTADLKERLGNNSLSEEDRSRLLNQATRAKQSGFFKDGQLGSLYSARRLLTSSTEHHHPLLEDDRATMAYVNFHLPLIVLLFKGDDSINCAILKLVIEQTAALNPRELKLLYDGTKALNQHAFSPRM